MSRHPVRVLGSSPSCRGAGALGWALLVAALGCGGAAPAESQRYPEKKRPEPVQSASDGEVLGANRQAPEDTLEGSLTNTHGAPRGPGAEHSEAAAAHQHLEHEECVEANQAQGAGGAGGQPKKKRLCPPPPPAPRD